MRQFDYQTPVTEMIELAPDAIICESSNVATESYNVKKDQSFEVLESDWK